MATHHPQSPVRSAVACQTEVGGMGFLTPELYRRFVVDCALHQILVPAFVPLVEGVMTKLYETHKEELNKNGSGKGPPSVNKYAKKGLEFDNINGNYQRPKGAKMYKVNSAVDLTKLFLEKRMAKFPELGDMDGSALLNILKGTKLPEFHNLTAEASAVKERVRDVWGHCADTTQSSVITWDEHKMEECFRLMRELINAAVLPPTVINELNRWEEKGSRDLTYSMNHLTAIANDLQDLKRVRSYSDNHMKEMFDDFQQKIKHEIDRLISELRTGNQDLNSFSNSQRNDYANQNKITEKWWQDVPQEILEAAFKSNLDYICEKTKPDTKFVIKLQKNEALTEYEVGSVDLIGHPYDKNKVIIDKFKFINHFHGFLQSLDETKQSGVLKYIEDKCKPNG